MEGSVQNLIKAEKEAKDIVSKAQKDRKRQAEQANTHAQQKVNDKMKHWEQKLKDEAVDVSKLRDMHTHIPIRVLRRALSQASRTFSQTQFLITQFFCIACIKES